MVTESGLVDMIRNADPMLINELIRACCHRFDEINPDFTMTFFVVDKKRNFTEQADEYISFMKNLKEIESRKQENTKVIPFNRHK